MSLPEGASDWPAGAGQQPQPGPTLSLDDIDAAIAAFDDNAAVLDVAVGRYSAWAVCRISIKWLLVDGSLGFNVAGAEASRMQRRPTGRFRRALVRAGFAAEAARDLLANRHAMAGRAALALCRPRPVAGPDGVLRDALWDELLSHDLAGCKPLVLEFPSQGTERGQGMPARLRAGPYLSRIGLTARRLRRAGAFEVEAKVLAGLLQNMGGALTRDVEPARLANLMRRFEASRRVHAGLLRRVRPALVLLTNGAGNAGALAAARDAGVPTVELQHGTFGPLTPNLHWGPEAHRRCQRIPAADRLLVYGDRWRDFLLAGGFWQPEQVVAVGSAALDRFRKVVPPHRAGGTLRVLFPTQPIGVAESLAFWERLLEAAKSQPRDDLELILKLHPAEAKDQAPYRELQARWPRRVQVVDTDASVLQAIMSVDVVAGHHSTSQLEALALGVPTVSICNSMVRDGLAGSQGWPWLLDAVPHVREPDELLRMLPARSSTLMAQWRQRTHDVGANLFTPGFLGNARAAIRDLLTHHTNRSTP